MLYRNSAWVHVLFRQYIVLRHNISINLPLGEQILRNEATKFHDIMYLENDLTETRAQTSRSRLDLNVSMNNGSRQTPSRQQRMFVDLGLGG